MARKYPYDTSAAALLTPAKDARFFENWDDTDTANHDLLCAEMSRLAYAQDDQVESALRDIGFSMIGFVGPNPRDTQGFAAKNAARGLTVLAFRGTEANRFQDLVSDAETLQQDFPRGQRVCRVHAGFLKAYEPPAVQALIAAVRAQGSGSLLITGHSLGAALATLAAVDTAPARLITFGSPRVGDAELRALLAGLEIRRFVDCCDVVSRVPPERFDAEHFSALLEELGVAGASLLGGALARLKLDGQFAHVADARYIRADGTVTPGLSVEEQRADQQAARVRYREERRMSLVELGQLLKSLLPSSPLDWATLTDLKQISREILRRLIRLVNDKPVPLRDLADHAPINYFSGIAGRA